MKAARLCLVLVMFVGCKSQQRPCELPFSYYNAPDFEWRQVARVLVLPLVNETAYPQASEEMQRTLHAELQRLGRFEVVPASAVLTGPMSEKVRTSGRFNEAAIIELARCTSADAILTGTLSHYSPYQRPRIGLTLQMISPDLGRVVGSTDGLWDANVHAVADRARTFYTRDRSPGGKVCDHILGTIDNDYAADLVLESPHLFGRFVCHEAAHLLVGDPAFRTSLQPGGVQSRYAPHPTVRLGPLLHSLCSKEKCLPAPAAPAPEKAKTEKTNEPRTKEPPTK
jgi:hypothetical protein